jgi:hypothetical protein
MISTIPDKSTDLSMKIRVQIYNIEAKLQLKELKGGTISALNMYLMTYIYLYTN